MTAYIDTPNGPVVGSAESGTAVVVDVPATGDIVLPEGISLADSGFHRVGNDLQVTAESGETVVIRDYFDTQTLPALRTVGGASLSSTIVSHLARSESPTEFAAEDSPAPEQPIGRIHSTVGEAIVIRADGTREEIGIDTLLFAGDVIETKDGAIGAILADDTSFSMADQGRMVLDSLVYDPDIEEGSMSLAVLKGEFTFVGGLASQSDPEAMTIITPVATIGLQGAQLGLDLAGGNELTVTLMSEADGFIGEAVIINDAGVQVLNQMHMTTQVSSAYTAPAPIFEMDLGDVIGTYSAPLLHLPLAHGRENDYQVQIERDVSEVSEFETDAGGEPEPTPTIKVVDGDYTEVPSQPPVETDGHILSDFGTQTPAPSEVEEDEPVQPAVEEDFGITVNYEPLAFDESVDGVEDNSIIGRLTAIDADDDGLLFTVAEGGAPAHGAVDMNADGSFTYTPEADFNGVDSFSFIVDDGRGGIDTATVSINVEPVPDRPELSVTATAGPEDSSIPITIEALVAGKEGLETIVISGLPVGAVLNLGTDTGDGAWLIGGNDLDNLADLTLTPASDWTGKIGMTILATSTDGGTSTAGFGVLVTGVPDVPALTVESAAGIEDTAISLSISATVPGTETLASVTVTGVPEGAALSLGADQGGGVWIIENESLDRLDELAITPAADWSGEVPLQVSAASTDGGTASAGLNVSVGAVADAPTLSVSAAAGSEDAAIPLSVTATVPGNEEVASVTISGVPDGAKLSLGTDNDDGSWTISGDDLADIANLTITPPVDWAGDFTLQVTATSTDGGTATAGLGVDVIAVPDLPVLTVSAAEGVEDSAVALAISATVPGNENVASVTIAGVPEGAVLSLGTDNGDGSWTIDGEDLDELASLTVTPPADATTDFSLNVEATSTDGGTATADFGIAITPVADLPDVQVTDVFVDGGGLPGDDKLKGTRYDDILIGGGGDDQLKGKGGNDILYGDSGVSGAAATVALDIRAAVADTDSSESLSITLGGFPEDVSLSAGTDLGGGTWSLTVQDLDDLTMTLPDGFSESFQIEVTAISTDIDPDSPATDTTSVTTNIDVTYLGGEGSEAGDDRLFGGAGDDILYGGGGRDDLRGDAGDDVLKGGAGDDKLRGGSGDDILTGGEGDDDLRGDGGDDLLAGGAGDDALRGGGGEDTLVGGAGDDVLRGEGGDDILLGGAGSDVLRGDGGDDRLSGGAGDDILSGGGGRDSFVFEVGSGSDTLTDYKKGESLRFEGDDFSEDLLSVTQDGDHAIVSFDGHDVEVTLEDVDSSQGYTVTQEPDAIVVVFDDNG